MMCGDGDGGGSSSFSSGGGRVWGEKVVTEVVLQGKIVEGVRIELVGLGREYIVATAVDCGVVGLPDFELVKVSSDGGSLECSLEVEGGTRLLSYDMNE